MLQLYYGNGKGKTSAAVGCAIRAAGSGRMVLFTQFLKNESSSEINTLKTINNIDCHFPTEQYKLFEEMDTARKAQLQASYNDLLIKIADSAEKYGMIVLDEALTAYNLKLINTDLLVDFINRLKSVTEIVITGHKSDPTLLALADYASEIKMIRHPFTKGIPARKGIEY